MADGIKISILLVFRYHFLAPVAFEERLSVNKIPFYVLFHHADFLSFPTLLLLFQLL